MPTTVDQKFNFKARKITDSDGKVIGNAKKQDPVTVPVPVPTAEELIQFLQAPESAESKYILGLASDAIRDQIRSQFDEAIESFGDDSEKQVSADLIDYDKLSLSYIANLPPSQRGVRALTEEEKTAFNEDYFRVISEATGKEGERIKRQLAIFEKPTTVQHKPEVLTLLIGALDLYLSRSQRLEETSDVAERYRNKFEKWLKANENYSADNL